jgi:prepilin-type processing-associated H-X9-DG protein
MPIDFAGITDGASNTMMIGEKRLKPANYMAGDWHDDRGWTDGWDPDTMRSTGEQFGRDLNLSIDVGFMFGSAHPGGMNALFADGSIRHIPFTVDKVMFDRMGDRMDGQPVTLP